MQENNATELKPFISNYYNKFYGGILEDKKQYTCPNPNHADKHPSATFYQSSNNIYCHVCNKKYDLFNLIEFNERLSQKEAYKRACELYGTKFNKDKTKFDYWHENLLNSQQAKDFIFSRGFNLDTLKSFNIGFNADYNNIIIPITENQYTTRNLNPTNNNDRYKKQNNNESLSLFNSHVVSATNDKDYCFVCEGEFDAMSFAQIGVKAIALRGVGNVNLLFDTIKNKNITFILALDNDDAGIKCKNEIAEKCLKLGFAEPKEFNLGKYKDPNEMFVASLNKFTKQARDIIDNYYKEQQPIKNSLDKEKPTNEYNNKSCLALLKDFENYINENKEFKPLSTGFKELDIVLDGGIRTGLYVVGAISSLGKTTFTMQIADNVAKQGNDVIIFSLEMSRNQLIAKSLSRLTYENEKSYAKNTGEILHPYHYSKFNENDINVIERAKQKYCEFADNIFIFENDNGITAEQIRKGIERHIKERQKKPFVVIDFMQLIAPAKDCTDKQNMDAVMLALKSCTTKYDIPILLISSINREAYNQKISLQSLKESGGIEYSAEVILGLQYKGCTSKDFDIEEAKSSNPRTIDLCVLKNRFGESGKKIDLDFYPHFNYFREEKEDFSGAFARRKNST